MANRVRNRSPWGTLPRSYDRRGPRTVSLPYWTQLLNAITTDTPGFLFYHDASFETVDGSGNISAMSNSFPRSDNLSQPTAARRPKAGVDYIEFDKSNIEWFRLNWGAGDLGPGDWSCLICCDLTGKSFTAPQAYYLGIGYIENLLRIHTGDTYWYGWNGQVNTTHAPVAEPQYQYWKIRNGAGNSRLRVKGVDVGIAFQGYTGTKHNHATDYGSIGAWADGSLPADINVKCIGVNIGYADMAAIETIMAEIMGL